VGKRCFGEAVWLAPRPKSQRKRMPKVPNEFQGLRRVTTVSQYKLSRWANRAAAAITPIANKIKIAVSISLRRSSSNITSFLRVNPTAPLPGGGNLGWLTPDERAAALFYLRGHEPRGLVQAVEQVSQIFVALVLSD
jgi:hypothetical protein